MPAHCTGSRTSNYGRAAVIRQQVSVVKNAGLITAGFKGILPLFNFINQFFNAETIKCIRLMHDRGAQAVFHEKFVEDEKTYCSDVGVLEQMRLI